MINMNFLRKNKFLTFEDKTGISHLQDILTLFFLYCFVLILKRKKKLK